MITTPSGKSNHVVVSGSKQKEANVLSLTNKNMLIEQDESSLSRERKSMFKIKKVSENAINF